MAAVKLFGTWLSPYFCRVICALKLKAIPYEYIEEDLLNKSPSLLQYNPVHKKIPVLVHDGRPICESAIILQYIDETWPQNPLLPTDPYERAVALFWIKFADEKTSSIGMMYLSVGDGQEKAAKECSEMLGTIEEHGLVEGKKFFGGDEINMVDIAFCLVAHWLGVIEEVTGLKPFEPHKFPKLNSWILNFNSVPVIEESLPNAETMFAFFKARREMVLASKSS